MIRPAPGVRTVVASPRDPYNSRVLGLLAPAAVAAACLTGGARLDVEIGRRAMPWLPPDLARQVVKHEREFAAGAAAAAQLPAASHRAGGVEAAILRQSESLARAIRNRAPFAEVVTGLGTLAHLVADLECPFPSTATGDANAKAFANYARSAQRRIPLVFYGQPPRLLTGQLASFEPVLAARGQVAVLLGPLVVEDLARVGGPQAWQRLDDRSTSFGVASIVLNRAASNFANLSSWVWYSAGGLVPALPTQPREILVWKGEARPRDIPRNPQPVTPGGEAPGARLSLR